ncbi:MAG TPA: ammonium transporter [Alphaproteobacteria bacterium]|nr:ammonium transporter [Alphaproteobacteria bacterium]
MTSRLRSALLSLFTMLVFLGPAQAMAQDNTTINTGNTAWMLTATTLVLFMTLPGLALFYGGLVRQRNVLSVLMHCSAVACLASVLWMVVGYSIAFGNGGALNDWFGGFGHTLMAGITADSMWGDIPETVFFMFQMTFAIITPALIIGAYPERIRFSAVMWFSGLWLVIVYAPVCHWVWGGGWLQQMGVRDFAGGLVVHTTCGVSALICAVMLGARDGFPHDVKPPHNPGLTMMGAAMLWVGWFGFNAGSALAAGSSAGMAMTVTHLAAASAALTWMGIEWIKFGKPSLIGTVTGMIAGLATITPASGFVGPASAILLGFLAGIVCFYMVGLVKSRFRIDDTLDVFAVHGVGGMMGSILCGVLSAGGLGILSGVGLDKGVTIGHQLWVQILGVAATGAWAGVWTAILLIVIRAMVGLRVSPEDELQGLDLSSHGERGYNL